MRFFVIPYKVPLGPLFLLPDVVSRFAFKYPFSIESSESGTKCGVTVDEDGDLILCRKSDVIQKEGIIAIGNVFYIIIQYKPTQCTFSKLIF